MILAYIGVVAISMFCGYVAALLLMRLSEALGFWSHMELAGIVPMLILGAVAFTTTSLIVGYLIWPN